MSVTHDNIRVFHHPNLIFITMLGMENFRHAPQAKKHSGYGVGSGVNRLSFASSFDWRNKILKNRSPHGPTKFRKRLGKNIKISNDHI